MKWTELDHQVPALAWVDSEPYAGTWKSLRAQSEAIVNHLVRELAGLPSEPIDRELARAAIGSAYHEAFMTFGYGAGGSADTSERWKGLLGLCAAALGDSDLVARCSGGRPLGSKIVAGKTFGDHTRNLARYLGTADRARAPASHVAAAMTELREALVAGKLREPRVALVAAYIYLRRIAIADDVPAAFRAWLEGRPVELLDAPSVQAVADGDEPRVTIFERYAAELADEDHIARATEFAGSTIGHDLRDRNPSPFAEKLAGEAAVFLFMARRPIPAGWEERLDPILVEYLGGAVEPALVAAQRSEQARRGAQLLEPRRLKEIFSFLRTDAAVLGLLAGAPALVVAMTGGKPLAAWKPGKFFKDDFHKLARYLASAPADGAAVADVEPALLDFLARRSPGTTSEIKGGALQWLHLLALAAVVYERLGKRPAAEVGAALRRAVTGV